MNWYVYKVNAHHKYGRSFGDWDVFFNTPGWWDEEFGSTARNADLGALKTGDLVFAYQTDRNELVGLALVRSANSPGPFVFLTPVAHYGLKVRPLKEADARIAAMPAWEVGPVRTLYSVKPEDAEYLIRLVQKELRTGAEGQS